MDSQEIQLIDKLNRYSELQKELQKCTQDIEELLLLYNFDIDEISRTYPVIKEIYHSKKSNMTKRIKTYF